MEWLIKDNKLVKEFEFNSQTELAIFLKIIAVASDQLNHHPDIPIYKATYMKLELITHEKKAINSLDYTLSTIIDETYDQFLMLTQNLQVQ